ncbi:uncharacterized [Tachysurus ichikawai]
MGYQEHIQQMESHSRGIVLCELASDHEHSSVQNSSVQKSHRIQAYTRWIPGFPSESCQTERRKMKQIFTKLQEWRAEHLSSISQAEGVI